MANGGRVSGLACPACAGTGLSGFSVCRTALTAPPSIEDDVYAETQVLIYTLQGSHLFPDDRVAEWIADLDTLQPEAPARSQSVIEAIGRDYRRAKQDAARNVDRQAGHSAPGIDAALLFERETSEIERHLAFLGALMTHARRQSEAGAGGRKPLRPSRPAPAAGREWSKASRS